MSTQPTAQKASLQGVKIKARKRQVKASAKHEPTIFRDQLYKHLEPVTDGDFDGYANALIQAGSTLEYLKYADALFEILLVGGLLQPGGTYLPDGAPFSPFSILKAKEPAEVDDMKKYVDVLNKLIRRYKYLQKPLEESSLPALIQYCNRWPAAQIDQFAIATGLLMSQGLASTTSLQTLSKDHLVKNDLALNVATLIFKAYLADQSMQHLGAALRRGGVKDLLTLLPANKREPKTLEDHFKAQGLPQVAEWFTKKQFAAIKDGLVVTLKEMCQNEEKTEEEIIDYLKTSQEEQPIPDVDFIACVWTGLMSAIDWNARAEQNEGMILREIGKWSPILEPFCTTAKTQVSLINTVQLYCYEETRITKSFSQILKVLYNKDCISDQAIIFWHQKGAKPQGKQSFLKATEALVKFLQEQESEEEE
ncbi:ARM repeat-containing protein [Rickenella mellea]|uniref:ARM repeat-containing protein n=1 Tax=Rickenella mellea TaxID=50990 RepID=A0A4Y7Q5I8_9AGAM|nr:ARM repeat-containing protein [Rickenella mellea]